MLAPVLEPAVECKYLIFRSLRHNKNRSRHTGFANICVVYYRFTANTMSSAIEALGMSLPYSSSIPAVDPLKTQECLRAGVAIRTLLERDIKPSDIMTRKAFENALTLIMVLGGSTNAVLHMIAVAKSVGVPLTIDDFQTVADKTPFLANLRPR